MSEEDRPAFVFGLTCSISNEEVDQVPGGPARHDRRVAKDIYLEHLCKSRIKPPGDSE
jgi:hypothetical protein